jgi:pSer/pThr/pTyr-binding forkhead associated (FHA) protein
MKKPLSKIEERMESLVEGTFARLFAGKLQPRDIAVQLARALEDSLAGGAPALRYAVRLHPADAQALLGEQPRLAEFLAEDLVAAAREGNITLPRLPEILILPDALFKPRTVTVTAEAGSLSDTATSMPVTAPLDPNALPELPNAFLILEGERTVPLSQPVISLGRRLDNHIILDDPRISRAHAQLRLRFGRYVLYDLGSTGGTYVNGQRINECVLRPGDVISLAGVPVIYGEDEGQRPVAPSEPPAVTRSRPDVATRPFDPGKTQPR